MYASWPLPPLVRDSAAVARVFALLLSPFVISLLSATDQVIVDVVRNLGMNDYQLFCQSMNRENLHYEGNCLGPNRWHVERLVAACSSAAENEERGSGDSTVYQVKVPKPARYYLLPLAEGMPTSGSDPKQGTLGYRASEKRFRAVCFQLDYRIGAIFYHAGMQNNDRERAQELFMSGQKNVICATTAFGMGETPRRGFGG